MILNNEETELVVQVLKNEWNCNADFIEDLEGEEKQSWIETNEEIKNIIQKIK